MKIFSEKKASDGLNLPPSVISELSKLSEDERAQILKSVGLKSGSKHRKKQDIRETSAERRERRRRSEERRAQDVSVIPSKQEMTSSSKQERPK